MFQTGIIRQSPQGMNASNNMASLRQAETAARSSNYNPFAQQQQIAPQQYNANAMQSGMAQAEWAQAAQRPIQQAVPVMQSQAMSPFAGQWQQAQMQQAQAAQRPISQAAPVMQSQLMSPFASQGQQAQMQQAMGAQRAAFQQQVAAPSQPARSLMPIGAAPSGAFQMNAINAMNTQRGLYGIPNHVLTAAISGFAGPNARSMRLF